MPAFLTMPYSLFFSLSPDRMALKAYATERSSVTSSWTIWIRSKDFATLVVRSATFVSPPLIPPPLVTPLPAT